MKRISIICAVAVLLLLCGACKQQERTLLSYSVSDKSSPDGWSLLREFVWKDGVVEQLRLHNPSKFERPEFEDWDSFFNYDLDYTYENGVLRSLTGNKYRTEFTYEGDKLVRVDQFSKDEGVHAYRVTFNYEGDDKVNADYYAMSHDALLWLESGLYPRKDSTGTRVQIEMPEDTTLHLSAQAVYQWQNGNLVSVKTDYIGQFTIESRMEYDDKVNPFYKTYGNFDKLDLLSVTYPYAGNNLGVSKNNLTKITWSTSLKVEDKPIQEMVFEYSYKYDGDYPVLQKDMRDSLEYRYEYVK